MSIDIEAIRARAEAANYRNLHYIAASGTNEYGEWQEVQYYDLDQSTLITVNADDKAKETAEFIAHAREDVPALLDEVERLRVERDDAEPYWKMRAERDRLRAAVNAVRDVATHCDFDCGCTECMMARAVLAALDEHLGEG